MPLVIECGMPLDTFWHDDMRLLECYSKAHYNRIEQTAWLTGARVYEAVAVSLNNAFSKQKQKYSPKPNRLDDIQKSKAQVTKKDDVYEFNEWVHNFRKMKGVSDDGNV